MAKVIYKIDIEKNQKAIKRGNRNKMLGKIFALVFVLIFVGSIVGATAFAYNTAADIWWTQIGEEANVEFKELFTLFNGVGDTDESKIVTKGYTEEDLKGFYSNLKRKLYLAEDSDISISKIISTIMSSASDGSGQSGEVATVGVDGYDLQYVYTNADGEQVYSDEMPNEEDFPNEVAPDSGNDGSLTGNPQLDQLLQEIEFDFTSLEDYDGQSNILEITDRQIASAINEALSSLSGSFEMLKDLEAKIGKPLKDVLQIKQIIIGGNGLDATQTSFKITLSIMVKDMLSGIIEQNNLPPIIKQILPKQLYATAIVYPNDPTKAVQVSINRMGEDKIDKIVRIADVILKKTGNTTSLSTLLVQVNSKVVEVISQAQKKVPLAFVPTGSVDIHPIETLMGLLDVNVSEQAFLTMIRDVKLPNAQSLGIDIPTAEIKHAKTLEFIKELSGKYCLDNSSGKITPENTINDIINFASGDEVISSVQLTSMKYDGAYDAQRLKVRTEYSALAAMLSDYVGGEDMLGEIKAEIVGMSYRAKGAMLSVDIKVDVAGMLGFDGSDVMASLISQLVPQEIFVSANICVVAELNTPSSVEINKVGIENSQQHLQTLTALAGKFGMDVSALDYGKLCAKIDESIKKGIAQIQEKIGCEIVFSEECAYLPNLFEVVCGSGALNESEEKTIAPESLYTIMKQVHTFELADQEKNKSQNADGFIDELESKYYLQEGKMVDSGDGKLLDSVMGLKDTFGSSIDKSALASDGRSMDKIYPLMSEGEFAYLMNDNIDVNELSSALKTAAVLGATSSEGELRLHIAAKLYDKAAVAEEEGEPTQPSQSEDLSKYSNLLPDTVYITVFIDTEKMINASEQSSVKVVIDGMNDESMDDFFSMVRKLTGKQAGVAEIESKIDAQVKAYMSKIKGIEYKFVNGGLQIDNLFNVIAKSDMVAAKEENAHVFAADEIRYLLRKLYGYDYSTTGQQGFTAAANLDNFIYKELHDKYFISDSFAQQLKGFDEKDQLLDGFSSIGGEEFSPDKVRPGDLTSLNNVTVMDGKSDLQLKSEIEGKFKPHFTTEEFAYLISKQVSVVSDISFMRDQKMAYVGNDENIMNLTLKGKGNVEDENAKGLMPDDFYVNLTIELGAVLSDGTRSNMNVYAMDINSVEYVEDGGEQQDLHLLITFIERIKTNTSNNGGETQPPQEQEEPLSLESILAKLEGNLNEFKAKIHNDIFTVTFLNDGGFIFNETIYQISLNSAYGAKAGEALINPDNFIDEINFRNGLCKVNNMPTTYRYKDDVTLDFAVGNRAADSSASISQINDRYALAKELEDGVAILTVLGEYAKDYATNIDGVKLTSSEKRAMTVEQLRPTIVGEELLLMLEKSVKIEADGYKDAVMTAMYVRDDSMIIVYQSGVTLNGESQKYAQLLPQKISLVVDIDVEKMYVPDALCANISINDLNAEEVSAIESFISKLNEKEGGVQNLTDANKECSDNVRSTMSALTNNMHVDFVADDTVEGVTGGGYLLLDSIYEIAANKINTADEGEKLTPQDVKETLEALHESLDISAYAPPSGYERAGVIFTVDSAQAAANNLLLSYNAGAHIKGAIGGWNIASMIETDRLLEPLGLDKNAAGNPNALKLKHTALIPTRANGDGTFEDMRDKLGALGDEEYFLITLDMDTAVAAGVKMTILPERMDLTLYMDITSQQVSVLYNAMSDRQRSILSRLVRTSRPEGVGGLDLSNTDAVKNEILGMKIIEHNFGGGIVVTVTLGQVLSSGGTIVPIDRVKEFETKNENIVLGMGAIIVDM